MRTSAPGEISETTRVWSGHQTGPSPSGASAVTTSYRIAGSCPIRAGPGIDLAPRPWLERLAHALRSVDRVGNRRQIAHRLHRHAAVYRDHLAGDPPALGPREMNHHR